MGLARTPPQRASAPAASSTAQTGAGASLPSPSQAFRPRNPGVLRSPVGGGATVPTLASTEPGVPLADQPARDQEPEKEQAGDGSEIAVEETVVTAVDALEDVIMEEDEQQAAPADETSATEDTAATVVVAKDGIEIDEPSQPVPQTTPARTAKPAQTPAQASEPGPSSTPLYIPPPPVTPARPRRQAIVTTPAPAPDLDALPPSAYVTPGRSGPKTPRSVRKTPAEIAKVLDKPAEPIEAVPGTIENVEDDYGVRWRATVKALDEAAKAGAQKWTAKTLEQLLPLIAAKDKGALQNLYTAASGALKKHIVNGGHEQFEHYRVPSSLQLIDQVVLEGKTYASKHGTELGRPDAWRPRLAPAALAASAVLPVYDEAWERLRDEYISLHEDSRQRYASILAKQAALKEMEGSVSDGVVELEQTIKVLDGFPNEEMTRWMEDVVARIGGARDP